MYTSLNKTYSAAPITQRKKAGSQKDTTAPAGQIFSKRSMTASSHMLPLSNILQKQTVTKEAALQRLQERVPAFQAGSEIIQVWDTDWSESNCHGYTFYQSPGHALDADGFLRILWENPANHKLPISLFFRGDTLCHSGRYTGGILTHLLIDIGILETNSDGTETFGYDRRFNLPKDIDEFGDFFAPIHARNLLLERVNLVTATFSDKYSEWLKHFNDEDGSKTEIAFNHIYDIKDQLEANTYPSFYLEGDDQYLEMEDFVRTFS